MWKLRHPKKSGLFKFITTRYDERRRTHQELADRSDFMILDGEENVVNQDIDFILQDWEYKPGIQPRLVQTDTGRQVIQMRVELGVLQIEIVGRPDGARPHGFPTYFQYLQDQARIAQKTGQTFVLSEEQCQEADREFVQFYHRRMCWLQRADMPGPWPMPIIRSASWTSWPVHSPSDEYLQAHEQYRGFVLFPADPGGGRPGSRKETPGTEPSMRSATGLESLLCVLLPATNWRSRWKRTAWCAAPPCFEGAFRNQYQIKATLEEQLQEAIADKDYERAARLRAALKNGIEICSDNPNFRCSHANARNSVNTFNSRIARRGPEIFLPICATPHPPHAYRRRNRLGHAKPSQVADARRRFRPHAS